MKPGIVIQARIGSTRLPQKVLIPIIDGKTILDILISRLQQLQVGIPIILATGDHAINAPLQSVAQSHNIHYFSGSEEDVLKRFINCAREYQLTKILRVCADNPFLDMLLITELLQNYLMGDCDYASYSVHGTPGILTHFGLFTELVSVKALENANNSTAEKADHEHVTRYLYNHPHQFRVKMQEAPADILQEDNVRLTIDTETDFLNAQAILKQLKVDSRGYNYNYKDVIKALKQLPEIRDAMKKEIVSNSKS